MPAREDLDPLDPVDGNRLKSCGTRCRRGETYVVDPTIDARMAAIGASEVSADAVSAATIALRSATAQANLG